MENTASKKLWEIRNEAKRLIENETPSNPANVNYQRDWFYLGQMLSRISIRIEELAHQLPSSEAYSDGK